MFPTRLFISPKGEDKWTELPVAAEPLVLPSVSEDDSPTYQEKTFELTFDVNTPEALFQDVPPVKYAPIKEVWVKRIKSIEATAKRYNVDPKIVLERVQQLEAQLGGLIVLDIDNP